MAVTPIMTVILLRQEIHLVTALGAKGSHSCTKIRKRILLVLLGLFLSDGCVKDIHIGKPRSLQGKIMYEESIIEEENHTLAGDKVQSILDRCYTCCH